MSMYFNIEAEVRGYRTYQKHKLLFWGRNCHDKGNELLNSEHAQQFVSVLSRLMEYSPPYFGLEVLYKLGEGEGGGVHIFGRLQNWHPFTGWLVFTSKYGVPNLHRIAGRPGMLS